MENDKPTNDTTSNGSTTQQPPDGAETPPARYTAQTLTNADIAELSRERLQTLLQILPREVAAILITHRPPMPPHVEYEAHKKLIGALARARAVIPSIPMDKTVDYVSKRTSERVNYSFASLDSIHKTVTTPLSEQGLTLECVFNGNVVVVLLSHDEGGIHLSWLPLPTENDIKDLATQITMRRRYLTTQLIAIVADEDTGERDIAEPKKTPQRRAPAQGAQRRGAPAAASNRQQAPAGADQLANRANALLAKLPKSTAEQLRKQYKDPNDLLRHTTEELNRRNAAKPQNAEPAPAGGSEPAASAGGQGTPPNPQTEKHINDGMRALRLSADEQQVLRQQFQGNQQGLFRHIKTLYEERQEEGRTQ